MKGYSVTLYGTASYDPDGAAINYTWTAPEGITLSSTNSPNPTFTAPNVSSTTDYTFGLIVNDGSTNSQADEVIVTVSSGLLTWTGSSGNDWNVANNWSPALVPHAEMDVVIANSSNQPVVGSEASNPSNSKTLTIQAGAALTIAPGKALTVSGAITNNAGISGLVLQSDATGTASLLHSTANVPATVQMAIPGDANQWHMIASPVDAQVATGTFIQDGHLFAWSEAAQSWIKAGTSQGWPTWAIINNSHDNFITAKGYLVKYNVASPNRTFTGNLNQGSLSYALELVSKTKDPYHGYQVMGNPYPSAIDWNAATGWERSKLVSETGGGKAYWIWNASVGNYGSFISGGIDGSGTNGATRYLAPYQAFWVKANAAGSLTMDNSVRVHSPATTLKEATIDNNLLLSVSGNANTYSDQALISLGNADNTRGAAKMFSLYATAPSLYTVKSELNYSINLLADVPKQPVALAFKAGAAGNYTIKATGGLLSKNVVLEDLQTGMRTSLSIDNSYRFKASTTDNPNRFLLHFGSTTAADKIIPTGPLATYNNGSLSILNPYSGISSADLFDVSGRLISTYHLEQEGQQQFDIELRQTGVYLIRISNNKDVCTGKFIFNN